MANSPLNHLDDDAIVALVKETIDSGRKATFFLSSAQSNAVRSWFFTPEPSARRGSGVRCLRAGSVENRCPERKAR
jgi:hypothetical protein